MPPSRTWPVGRWLAGLIATLVIALPGEAKSGAPGPLDPSARLLGNDDATEYWSLFVDLDSGHRITQQFLLTNAGPGEHTAVAIGHLSEPGRKPYRYENGRRRGRWTLSDDRRFFDIAASHLDLHRPTGELRITKDDIEIRLFFDFPVDAVASSVPRDRLPSNYHVDVLAIAAATRGTIHAPWMNEPLEVRGHTWLSHTWSSKAESELIDRRVELYAHEKETSFYGLRVTRGSSFGGSWMLMAERPPNMIESRINIDSDWQETPSTRAGKRAGPYPLPSGFTFSRGADTGQFALEREWLRFDPLDVIPQPFRWFVRRNSKPQQVWADARIGVTLSKSPGSPSLPDTGETESESNSNRETEEETAERSVTGVASITYLNPSERR